MLALPFQRCEQAGSDPRLDFGVVPTDADIPQLRGRHRAPMRAVELFLEPSRLLEPLVNLFDLLFAIRANRTYWLTRLRRMATPKRQATAR